MSPVAQEAVLLTVCACDSLPHVPSFMRACRILASLPPACLLWPAWGENGDRAKVKTFILSLLFDSAWRTALSTRSCQLLCCGPSQTFCQSGMRPTEANCAALTHALLDSMCVKGLLSFFVHLAATETAFIHGSAARNRCRPIVGACRRGVVSGWWCDVAGAVMWQVQVQIHCTFRNAVCTDIPSWQCCDPPAPPSCKTEAPFAATPLCSARS